MLLQSSLSYETVFCVEKSALPAINMLRNVKQLSISR
jgi:hypothetical protein